MDPVTIGAVLAAIAGVLAGRWAGSHGPG